MSSKHIAILFISLCLTVVVGLMFLNSKTKQASREVSQVNAVGEYFYVNIEDAKTSPPMTLTETSTEKYIGQEVGTDLNNGGKAIFTVQIPENGTYKLSGQVKSKNGLASNSFYININQSPNTDAHIWDFSPTTSFTAKDVTWRGSNTEPLTNLPAKQFTLCKGQHQIIIVGREAGAYLRELSLLKTGTTATCNPAPTATPLRPAPSLPSKNSVYSENFESYTSNTSWRSNGRLKVTENCGVDNTKCLRVAYVPTTNGSERLQTSVAIPPANEYTLNYDLFFENDFEFVKGGKLPGLSPNTYTTGCQQQVPYGWSVRLMWRPSGVPTIYWYDQNRPGDCGESAYADVRFEKNKWQALSLYVKVNDASSTSNGQMQLYINGKSIASANNIKFRGENGDHTKITRFFFSTFFGGNNSTWSPSKTVYSRFDNFAVYPGLRIRSAPGQ